MRIEVKLPFLGEEIESCRLRRWLIQQGQTVEIDQDIAEMEAGEETFLLPSPVDGRIVELCARTGELLVTDEVMAVVEDDYESPNADGET